MILFQPIIICTIPRDGGMEASQAHRYKELRLGQLRAFCECVRHKTFSAAARALGMSQPAVWQQVRALEREFGANLLQRQGGAWEPTEDGRVLLELASSIVGTMDALKELFDQHRRRIPRALRIISMPGVFTEELAGPVIAFCRHYPLIKVALSNYAGPESLGALVAGEADLAVLPLALEVGGNRQLLAVEPFATRAWAAVLPEGHALAGKRRLRPVDLVRQALILPEEGSVWRQRVDAIFRAAGLLDQLRVVLEVGAALAARRYVSLGLGLAVFPQPASALEFPHLCARPLRHLFPAEPIVLFSRRGGTQRPQARLFIEHLRKRPGQKAD
jgi:DNA-binding transcriptional LysR family regulator